MPQTHVLFVEDEDLIRLLVAEVLVEAGIEVTEACNGDAALALLQDQRGYDLLLTDVHMPGRLSGVDLARRARSLRPGMPVVFVTGRPDTLHAFGALGPRDRCVLKPYKPTEVLAAIRSILTEGARPNSEPTLPHGAGNLHP